MLIHPDVVSFCQLVLDDILKIKFGLVFKRIGGFLSTRAALKRVVGVVLDAYVCQRQCILRRGKCSCVIMIAGSLVRIDSSQESAVQRSRLSASLIEHFSMGQAVHPPRHRTTLVEQSVLQRLRPRCHCMCFIAEEKGFLHRLALAAKRSHFFGGPRVGGRFSVTLETSIQNVAIISTRQVRHRCMLQRVFDPLLGARQKRSSNTSTYLFQRRDNSVFITETREIQKVSERLFSNADGTCLGLR